MLVIKGFSGPNTSRSGLLSPVHDRCVEHRRAVAPTRHFRETEGLSIEQIAEGLDSPRATIQTYFYDPTGDKTRAVSAQYFGCPAAAAPTRSSATARTTPIGISGDAARVQFTRTGHRRSSQPAMLDRRRDTAGSYPPTTGHAHRKTLGRSRAYAAERAKVAGLIASISCPGPTDAPGGVRKQRVLSERSTRA